MVDGMIVCDTKEKPTFEELIILDVGSRER